MLSRDESWTEGPESKYEYFGLWQVFSEYLYVLKVKITISKILLIYPAWTVTRYRPLRK